MGSLATTSSRAGAGSPLVGRCSSTTPSTRSASPWRSCDGPYCGVTFDTSDGFDPSPSTAASPHPGPLTSATLPASWLPCHGSVERSDQDAALRASRAGHSTAWLPRGRHLLIGLGRAAHRVGGLAQPSVSGALAAAENWPFLGVPVSVVVGCTDRITGWLRALVEVEVGHQVPEDRTRSLARRARVGAAIGRRVEPLAVQEVVLDELVVGVEATASGGRRSRAGRTG